MGIKSMVNRSMAHPPVCMAGDGPSIWLVVHNSISPVPNISWP